MAISSLRSSACRPSILRAAKLWLDPGYSCFPVTARRLCASPPSHLGLSASGHARSRLRVGKRLLVLLPRELTATSQHGILLRFTVLLYAGFLLSLHSDFEEPGNHFKGELKLAIDTDGVDQHWIIVELNRSRVTQSSFYIPTAIVPSYCAPTFLDIAATSRNPVWRRRICQ